VTRHRVELIFDLPAGLEAGAGVVAAWNGEHGLASVNYAAPLQVANTPLFPGRQQSRGKGSVGYRVWSKTGAVVAIERAGKGVRPKGKGPKGASRPRARVTVLVPPVFGRRTFGIKVFDRYGNVDAGDPVTITATVSATPPRAGPAVYEGFADGAVTIRASERMR